MTRPRLLLLDADACICAHQCGGWQLLQQHYGIWVPETVVAEVSYYIDVDGNKHLLGLAAEVEVGTILQCSATPVEQAALLCRLHSALRLRLHAGEVEALAFLAHRAPKGMAFVTGDGAAIAAAHGIGFTAHLVSLESAYGRVGFTMKLRDDMGEDKHKEQLRRASTLMAQGRLLAT